MEISYRLELVNHRSEKDVLLRPYVELFYVVDGNGTAIVEGKTCPLLKNEILLINFGSNYEIEFGYDAVLAKLQIDYFDLLKMTGKNHWDFQCDTVADHARSHYHLRHAFSRMLRAHIMGDRILEERSALYDLLSILTREYVKKETVSGSSLDDSKMDSVLMFVHSHYREKISLNSLCKEFFYSVSTFTRNFKKKTGMSLVQYLNELRIAAAEEELCTTDHSVTDIAFHHGFADSATFHKVFKNRIGTSPSQYRKMRQQSRQAQKEQEEAIRRAENRYLKEAETELDVGRGRIFSKIVFDALKYVPGEKMWTKAFGVINGADLLEASYQGQILMLKENIDFKYIRISGLFSERMNIRRYPGSTELNFRQIDAAIDFLVTNQLLPILELSGEQLTIEENQNTKLCLKRHPNFFKDYDDYAMVMNGFFDHIMRRYTSGFAKYHEWVWEVNYDRSRFSLETYLKQFQLILNVIRKWNSKSKIGGFGCMAGGFREEELSYLVKNGYCPDFFSVKAYPYEVVEERKSVQILERSMDPNFMADSIRKIREAMDRNGCKEIPIWFTEWNISLSDRNILNDSFHKAAIMMRMITDLAGLAELAIYDTVSDISCITYEDRTFFGGRGMISRDGLEKPASTLMIDLEYMSGNITYRSENAFFSSIEPNHLEGLCFNEKNFNFSYYQKPEELLTEEEVSDIFENQDILEQEIHIHSLANGVYRIKFGRISEKSSALWRLGMMGKEVTPDIGDIRALQRTTFPEISTMEKTVKEHELVFQVRLLPNETIFVNIYPVHVN